MCRAVTKSFGETGVPRKSPHCPSNCQPLLVNEPVGADVFCAGSPVEWMITARNGVAHGRSAAINSSTQRTHRFMAERLAWAVPVGKRPARGWRFSAVAVARKKGLYRMEGKEYVVKDGDVLLFKFNV